MSRKGFVDKIKGYLKYEELETPAQRKAAKFVTVIVIVAVSAVWIPPLAPRAFGWVMIQGRSMWPTIKWMQSWPFVSGYVHIDRRATPVRGNMVVFRIDGKRWCEQCKRVDNVRGTYPKLEFWLSADNSGVTGEGSDLSSQYDWVPLKHVVGVVDRVWNPEWNARYQSDEGRFDNDLNLTTDPDWLIYREGRDIAVYVSGDWYTTINGKSYPVFPSGGEKGDPVLVKSDYSVAYRIRKGQLQNTKIDVLTPLSVSSGVSPKTSYLTERKGEWQLSGKALPISLTTPGMAADGRDDTAWFVPLGLDAPLLVDFGICRTREIQVVQSGRAAGDVVYWASRDGKSWQSVKADLRGFKPSVEKFPRQLGVLTCRYLRIGNSLSRRSGSSWAVYEIRS